MAVGRLYQNEKERAWSMRSISVLRFIEDNAEMFEQATPDCQKDEGGSPTSRSQRMDLAVGKVLRLLRKDLKQTEVTRRGGPDFRTISQWETGRKKPSLRLLFQYLTALDLDFHDFQNALDEITKRPARYEGRFTAIERRLSVLEREAEKTEPEEPNYLGVEQCLTLTET